jgi:hypothetical protein
MSITGAPARKGRPGRPGHVGQSGLHLHDLIQRAAMLVRPFQIPLQRQIDQPRVDLAQVLPAAAQTFDRAGSEVFQHDVRAADEPVNHGLALRVLEIDGDGALVAIVGREESRGEAGHAARWIALGRFDLDDVGAEVGEHDAGARSHDGMAEVENLHAGEGLRLRVHASFRRNDAIEPERSAALGSG